MQDFHLAAKVAVAERKIKPIEEYPVQFMYKFYFVKRQLDCINCGAMTKAIEDGLRACGILKDDSPKFVSAISLEVADSEKDYDYVEIYYD